MDKIRVLIVDPDERFAQQVSAILHSFADIDLIGAEVSGQEALRRTRETQPDLLLFDLILPGLDGISLLRRVNELPSPPATLCCTRFYSEVALESARNNGVSYLLYKPIDLTTLHPAIVDCARTHRFLCAQKSSSGADGPRACAEIRNYLVTLGIPSKLIGCSYLAEAIRLAREDISLTRNLSRGIYLEISRSMHTTPERIERCIRSAISAAFQTGGLDARMNACPSNKEFINYALRNLDF